MPVHEKIPRTRRQATVNLGNRAQALGPQSTPALVDYDEEQATDLILTVWIEQLIIPPEVASEGDIRPYVRVEWGHGATAIEQEFEVTRRQRIPVPGSTVRCVGFLKSMPLAQPDGTELAIDPVPLTCSATFNAFVSEHTDALPLVPTYWLQQMGVGQGNLIGPLGLVPAAVQIGQQARLVTLHGFVTLNSDVTTVALVYLMLFDEPTVPAAGDLPVDVIPLIATGPTVDDEPTIQEVPPDRYRFTLAFTKGVAWGVSSTPFAFTPVAIAEAFIKAEFEH
jgi:hypothetical protein